LNVSITASDVGLCFGPATKRDEDVSKSNDSEEHRIERFLHIAVPAVNVWIDLDIMVETVVRPICPFYYALFSERFNSFCSFKTVCGKLA
jgi:hypothetical protein